jgi:hypothetical protein
MNRLFALSLATLVTAAALAAAPALAQSAPKTELVRLDGSSAETLQLRYDFNATWLIDNQNILYRDDRRDYYLVTLKAPCETLDIRSRGFDFFPAWSWRLRSSYAYEIRPEAGSYCSVARIARLDDVRADPLREAAQRRVW